MVIACKISITSTLFDTVVAPYVRCGLIIDNLLCLGYFYLLPSVVYNLSV